MKHDPKTLARELEAAAEPVIGGTAEDLAKMLALVPPYPAPSLEALLSLDYDAVGIYLCGCPWKGFFIPHFCPVHPGAFVVFEIQESRS